MKIRLILKENVDVQESLISKIDELLEEIQTWGSAIKVMKSSSGDSRKIITFWNRKFYQLQELFYDSGDVFVNEQTKLKVEQKLEAIKTKLKEFNVG